MFRQQVWIDVEGLTEEEAEAKVKKVRRMNYIKNTVNTILPVIVPLSFGVLFGQYFTSKRSALRDEVLEADGVEFTTSEERDEEDSEL